MPDPADSTSASNADAASFGADDEAIAEAYEEEAALSGGPDDLPALVVRIRKIEERLATIEDYLGTPPSKSGSLEDRIEGLEGEL
jgi:hypothetical protein